MVGKHTQAIFGFGHIMGQGFHLGMILDNPHSSTRLSRKCLQHHLQRQTFSVISFYRYSLTTGRHFIPGLMEGLKGFIKLLEFANRFTLNVH